MPVWKKGPKSKTTMERFLEKIEVQPTGCWQWMGCKFPTGYAQIRVLGVTTLGHRYAYENLKGPIPEELQLDHLCRNRACVNPQHLEPVTHRENQVRGRGFIAENVNKTHCLNGHVLGGDNLTFVKGSNGAPSRRCQTCNRDRTRQYRERLSKKREET